MKTNGKTWFFQCAFLESWILWKSWKLAPKNAEVKKPYVYNGFSREKREKRAKWWKKIKKRKKAARDAEVEKAYVYNGISREKRRKKRKKAKNAEKAQKGVPGPEKTLKNDG